MKPFICPVTELLTQPDFSERSVMIEANMQKMLLGPVQSKRYFESVAIFHSTTATETARNKAVETLQKYHRMAKGKK